MHDSLERSLVHSVPRSPCSGNQHDLSQIQYGAHATHRRLPHLATNAIDDAAKNATAFMFWFITLPEM